MVATASGSLPANSSGTFSLQITRVVKGDSTLAGGGIPVGWVNGDAATSASGSGIWFLAQAAAGWQLIPAMQGTVPMNMTFFAAPATPILARYAYAEEATLSDKLASELCSAIETSGGTSGWPMSTLFEGQLERLQSPVVGVLFQRLSNSTSVPQEILGLAGQIRSGSGAALQAAAQSAAAFESSPVELGNLLLSVREDYRPSDGASVTALGQIADSSSLPADFRVAAAHALAAVHTASALPYLANLFGDADTNVRVEAIGGFALFVSGFPSQAPGTGLAYLQTQASAPFKNSSTMAHFALGYQAVEKNESFYLSFWQQWWAQNGAPLGN